MPPWPWSRRRRRPDPVAAGNEKGGLRAAFSVSPTRRVLLADPAVQQVLHVVGVLFLLGEDVLEHALGGGVAVADVVDHLAIAVDRDALGDEILADHVAQVG